MGEHVVADADEISDGGRIVVQLEGTEIGIFALDDELRAYLNWCPHQAGPLCEGTISGKYTAEFDPETLETDNQWIREGEFLYCPWHAWEFDLENGDCTTDRTYTLPSFPVREEDGQIVVTIP